MFLLSNTYPLNKQIHFYLLFKKRKGKVPITLYPLPARKRKKILIMKKRNPFFFFILPTSSSGIFFVVLSEAVVYHTVYPFAQTVLLANKCPLQWVVVWLEAFGFWTLNKIPLEYPAAALSHGDHVATFPQDWFLHMLQQFTGGTDAGVGQMLG